MKIKNKDYSGATMLEMMLVVAIIAAVSGTYIIKKQYEIEEEVAKNAGLQIEEYGKALGGYITRESLNLNNCISSAAAPLKIPLNVFTSDTGVTVVGSCRLNNRKVLDSADGKSLFGPEFEFYIKKNNTRLNGLVITASPIMSSGDPSNAMPKFNWIGAAMRSAGPQSGMTFTTTGANSLRGLGGGWQLSQSDYPKINQVGLLGYRVAYQGNNDDVYLRLDGAYPMRGNLNMGNYNMNNITDINFNGWLAGNNALLNNLKTGYISNSGSIVTNSLQAEQAITMGNLHNNRIPNTFNNSYVHTWDLYAEGTIATGRNGQINAYMDNTGQIKGKKVESESRTTVGEYIDLKGRAVVDRVCEKEGLVAIEQGSGLILSCQAGIWKKAIMGGLLEEMESCTVYIRGNRYPPSILKSGWHSKNGWIQRGLYTGGKDCRDEVFQCIGGSVQHYPIGYNCSGSGN